MEMEMMVDEMMVDDDDGVINNTLELSLMLQNYPHRVFSVTQSRQMANFGGDSSFVGARISSRTLFTAYFSLTFSKASRS